MLWSEKGVLKSQRNANKKKNRKAVAKKRGKEVDKKMVSLHWRRLRRADLWTGGRGKRSEKNAHNESESCKRKHNEGKKEIR